MAPAPTSSSPSTLPSLMRRQRTQPKLNTLLPQGPARVAVDALNARVASLVRQATAPNITDDHYERLQHEILSAANGGSVRVTIMQPVGGKAIASAIRERLQVKEEAVVMKTLTFLADVMQTQLGFHQFIGTNRFFATLWRLVVPQYRANPFTSSFIRKETSVFSDDVSFKVKVLVRAWAEELSDQLHGLVDPRASFIIDHYRSWRSRMVFPEPPKDNAPYVCPQPTSRSGARAAHRSSDRRSERRVGSHRREVSDLTGMQRQAAQSMLNEFFNVVVNAEDLESLKADRVRRLAKKCEQVTKRHPDLLNADFNGALRQYKQSLDVNRMVRVVPKGEWKPTGEFEEALIEP